MASKNNIIMDSLENLSKGNYAKFCTALVDRKGEYKVPKSKVEGKSPFLVTQVLVSTFTEAGAPAVVSQVLKDIGCYDEADDLDAEIEECDLLNTMPSKKQIILASLKHLSEYNYERFCSALVNRGGEHMVLMYEVEGQSRSEGSNVLVSTFTEDRAPAVVSEVLKFIGCVDEATKLDADIYKMNLQGHMASKKQIILASLKHLSESNYERFCSALVNRGGERKVRKSKVEGQSRENVTTVLLSTFTEDGAPAVVSEVLRFIGCVDEAKDLDAEIEKMYLPSKMASKKNIILESLENLPKNKYERFCSALVNRGGERKVRKSMVEGQSQLEVTIVLVSIFTEDGAPEVISEVLKFIGCLKEAEDLNADIDKKHLPSKMASKKNIILESLENLSKEDYTRFCLALVDRGGERRVPLSEVEDQPWLEVKNVLVSIFTEDGAPGVVSEVLKFIGCLKVDAVITEFDKKSLEASLVEEPKETRLDDLDAKTYPDDAFPQISKRSLNAFPDQRAGQLGVAKARKSSNSSGKHFVDKHRLQLIERVANISSILDGLLDQDILQDGAYEDISQTPGNQNKMRKIYQLALKSGDRAKNVFLELLRQKEPNLVKYLQDR